MQEMKYEINEDGHAITPCRFINNKFIGSCACNECDFIIGDDIVKQVVTCNYGDENVKI